MPVYDEVVVSTVCMNKVLSFDTVSPQARPRMCQWSCLDPCPDNGQAGRGWDTLTLPGVLLWRCVHSLAVNLYRLRVCCAVLCCAVLLPGQRHAHGAGRLHPGGSRQPCGRWAHPLFLMLTFPTFDIGSISNRIPEAPTPSLAPSLATVAASAAACFMCAARCSMYSQGRIRPVPLCSLLTLGFAAAAGHGYCMPLDLGAKGSCQIGGNVSTNAGAPTHSECRLRLPMQPIFKVSTIAPYVTAH